MAAGRLAGGVRLQNAITQHAARPRKLALAAYVLFGVAFTVNFPEMFVVALGAVGLNAVATLGGTTLLAAIERRWMPSLSCAEMSLWDRSLRYSTLIWFYSAVVFGVLALGALA